MNFKYLVSSIAAAALLMTGCVKEQIGGDLDQIKFEKTIMELPNTPGEVSVKMTATEAWEFNAESVLDDPETGEPWLSVSPASGVAGDFDIVFEALTSYYKDRADTVEFICGGVSQYVILNQPADPSKKPDFEDFVAGDYYIMFLEDDGGNDDASDDKYLVAMPVPQGSSYGYLNAQSAERDEEGNLTSAASNIFSFKETEGGFTIQDAYGKYYYMSGSYNSANVSATLPSSGHVWTVEQTDYYEYTITNVATGKWMQYSTEHTSMGIYDSAQDGALMPYLVPTVAPSLIKIEQNEYTLQKVAGVLDVPAEIDGNVSVSFEADWLSYVGVKYIDGQSCLEFNYDENDGAEPRTATVLVSVSDGARVSTAELKITQRNIIELPEGLAEDGTSGDPYSVASANAIFDYDAWFAMRRTRHISREWFQKSPPRMPMKWRNMVMSLSISPPTGPKRASSFISSAANIWTTRSSSLSTRFSWVPKSSSAETWMFTMEPRRLPTATSIPSTAQPSFLPLA